MPAGLRRVGAFAAMVGLAAVMLPWTTGVAGPSATLEQFGYLLHLPLMIWYGTLGWRLRNGGWSGTAARGAQRERKRN